jgi:hypothetical protein
MNTDCLLHRIWSCQGGDYEEDRFLQGRILRFLLSRRRLPFPPELLKLLNRTHGVTSNKKRIFPIHSNCNMNGLYIFTYAEISHLVSSLVQWSKSSKSKKSNLYQHCEEPSEVQPSLKAPWQPTFFSQSFSHSVTQSVNQTIYWKWRFGFLIFVTKKKSLNFENVWRVFIQLPHYISQVKEVQFISALWRTLWGTAVSESTLTAYIFQSVSQSFSQAVSQSDNILKMKVWFLNFRYQEEEFKFRKRFACIYTATPLYFH